MQKLLKKHSVGKRFFDINDIWTGKYIICIAFLRPLHKLTKVVCSKSDDVVDTKLEKSILWITVGQLYKWMLSAHICRWLNLGFLCWFIFIIVPVGKFNFDFIGKSVKPTLKRDLLYVGTVGRDIFNHTIDSIYQRRTDCANIIWWQYNMFTVRPLGRAQQGLHHGNYVNHYQEFLKEATLVLLYSNGLPN